MTSVRELTQRDAPHDEPRFEFGANWQRFLTRLDEQRIAEAETSLVQMLDVASLEGLSFLDVGSGSGLFSLAAMRMGAKRVHSFDYDPDSVACARELKRRFFPDAERWTIEQGDATDPAYVSALGSFDVVYPWGVLHHTGDLWRSMENVCDAVAEGGRLYLALYNDQGWRSRYWHAVKRTYARAPRFMRPLMIVLFGAGSIAKSAILHLARGDIRGYIRSWSRTGGRGMNRWNDLVDWIGGYPFEVSRPEEVFDFCTRRGFELKKLRTTNGLDNNEFLFVKRPAA